MRALLLGGSSDLWRLELEEPLSEQESQGLRLSGWRMLNPVVFTQVGGEDGAPPSLPAFVEVVLWGGPEGAPLAAQGEEAALDTVVRLYNALSGMEQLEFFNRVAGIDTLDMADSLPEEAPAPAPQPEQQPQPPVKVKRKR